MNAWRKVNIKQISATKSTAGNSGHRTEGMSNAAPEHASGASLILANQKQIFARKKKLTQSLRAQGKWRPGQIKDALQCTVSERAKTSLRGERRCFSRVTIPLPEEVSSGLLETRGHMEVQDRVSLPSCVFWLNIYFLYKFVYSV